MNLVENQHTIIQEQAEEIQRLRDENNRLKGEQGKPKIRANKPVLDQSSEKERRESKPHHKKVKQAQVRIDRVEVLKVDHEQLPQDAQFKGYEEVIVQDIEFRTENRTVPQGEVLLSKSKTNVSRCPSYWLQRPIWAKSPSLGIGPLLRRLG